MPKVERRFISKAAGLKWIERAKAANKGVQGGSVYMKAGHYYAMVYGDMDEETLQKLQKEATGEPKRIRW